MDPHLKGKYSTSVRIGDWLNSIINKEEEYSSFLRKHSKENLLVQRTRLMIKNLTRSVHQEAPTGSITYNSYIMLTSSTLNEDGKMVEVTMCGSIGMDETYRGVKLMENCKLTASAVGIPCVRSVFQVKSYGNTTKENENVRYGDPVVLTVLESDSPQTLYVASENKTLNSTNGLSTYPIIRLTKKLDRNCIWKFYKVDPVVRAKSVGFAIEPNADIIVNHSVSNQNLCIESKFGYLTFFGFEWELTTHNIQEIKSFPVSSNKWKIKLFEDVNNKFQNEIKAAENFETIK